MAWQTMIPSPGGRRAEEIATLACRDNSRGEGRHYSWIMTLSQSMRARLGWPGRLLVQVEVDTDAGLARVAPTQHKALGWTMTLNKTALQGVLPLPHQGRRLIPATRVPFEVDGSALILRLPEWAGGREVVQEAAGRAPRGRASSKHKVVALVPPPEPPPIEPAKAITPQAHADKEDLREALLMLRGGSTTVAVMEHFGWPRERVENLRRTLASVRRVA